MDLNKWKFIDSKLKNPERVISLLKAIQPVNEDTEKERMFSNYEYEPCFEYNPLPFDTKEEEERLKSIHIPEGYFNKLFEDKRQEKLLLNKMKEAAGSDRFKELSVELYGKQKNSVFEEARKNLDIYREEEFEPKTISFDELEKRFEQRLFEYGLNDWNVKLSDRKNVTVHSSKKAIYVPKRDYGQEEMEKLLLHENDCHVLRAANGYKQPLPEVFSTGLTNFTETEEGLAFYLQELNGLMPVESIVKMSVNVLTIDNMLNDEPFKKTFCMLKDYGFDDEFAWNRTVRAYRGGGLTKDHLYASGIDKLRRFHQAGNDLAKLYIGKISLHDLEWIEPLINADVIKLPTYLPKLA